MQSSVTSSFRISKELYRRLTAAAKRTGKRKNALIIEAIANHLQTLEKMSLAGEARRQSELVSRNDLDERWYDMADTTGWK